MTAMEERYATRGNFSIIFADVNRLKYVNDTFGHHQGDLYIRAACDLARQSCRFSDYCFRVGCDEIVIFMFDCTRDGAQEALEKMESLMSEDCLILENEKGEREKIAIRISLGLASNSEMIPVQDVLRVAEERMEQNKREWYRTQGIERRT